MKNLKNTALSVLDLAKVSAGKSYREAFENSKHLAKLAEKLNYKRFWLAEHHSIEGIASAATSVLIGYIAENTSRIRVGSGGIMLPNHSPLVIAEQFGTLESLYPGRIDLGLGRAPGTDQGTMRAIRRGAPEADFGDAIQELLHYFAPAEPTQKIKAIPGAGITVPLYILGSSLYSSRLAARTGRPYAFAGHFAPALMMQAFEIYRNEFRPSPHLEKPYVMLGIPVVGAETDERARYVATTIQQAFLGLIRGDRTLSKPPVDDIEKVWAPHEKAAVQSMLGLLVTGSAARVRAELDELIRVTQADELIITSDAFDFADRLRSFEIIAQAKDI